MSRKGSKHSTKFTNKDIAAYSGPTNMETTRRFYEEVGMDDMAQAIAHCNDQRAKKLLGLMYDPGQVKRDFATLCLDSGLSLGDVVDMFRRWKLDIGILRMAKHTPDVMEDTAIDAKATFSSCRRCDGLGYLSAPDDDVRNCPTCDGVGKIRKPGDQAARDAFYKTTGLYRPQTSINIAVGNTFDPSDALRDMDKVINTTAQPVTDQKG